MIFCRFKKSNLMSYGIVEDDAVRAVDGDPFNGYKLAAERYPLREVELLVPVIPGTFYAIGSNYHNHVVGRAKVKGRDPIFYKSPRVGYRANSALLAHEADIVKPADAGPRFEYEAELVAVLGKPARKVSPSEAAECIFGWTIGNDLTERDWQAKDPTNLRGKNADTFKPMGPWIETDADPETMETIVRVNGRETNRFATNDMIFGIVPFLVELTKYFTLWPGDVIWMGTDGASPDLRAGDVVEIEITGIGTLRNRFVAEQR